MYYQKTDPSRLPIIIQDMVRSAEMQNEMTGIEAAETMVDYLGMKKEGLETLKVFGITGNIKQRISQRRTKFMMYAAKQAAKAQKTTNSDYYDLLGEASSQTGRNLNDEMLLVEWIGILNQLKRKNAAQQKINKK
jgi:hypothetical protein